MEIFTIDNVQNTKPITYLLKDNNNEKIKELRIGFIDKNINKYRNTLRKSQRPISTIIL